MFVRGRKKRAKIYSQVNSQRGLINVPRIKFTQVLALEEINFLRKNSCQ
jgi:hypothetical protein